MGHRIFRSSLEPIRARAKLKWEELWKGPDQGLITCWETGLERARKSPELSERAKRGELPVLGWKGGVEKKIKATEKYGTLYYLAQWQGLRGEDLDIDLAEEPEQVCTRTGMKVIFTGDLKKYGNADEAEG
jgi:hypothetical protein